MASDPVVIGGQVYDDATQAAVLTHPDVPQEIKRLYISPQKPTEAQGEPSSQPATPVAANENNAPAASVEPSGGTSDQEDGGPSFNWNFFSDLKKEFLKEQQDYAKLPDDQKMQQAMDLAMSFSGGGLTFGGVKGIANLRGAAQQEMKDNIGLYHILQGQGASEDEILRKTGFFQGADGRLKFEIDDSKANFNQDWYKTAKPKYTPYDSLENDVFTQRPFDPNENTGYPVAKLPDVLDHPDLYSMYPNLKNIDVTLDPKHPSAYYIANSPAGTIAIGNMAQNTKETFLHEIQHAIQREEGFATGGPWGKAGKTYQLKLADLAREKITNPLKQLYDEISTQQRNGVEVTDDQLKRLGELQTLARKYNDYARAGDAEAMHNYLRLAGEVEARNVEARALLTAKERRMYPPQGSEEFPREDQIVVYRPTVTTPYGVEGGRPGKQAAPVIPFRRAANDNLTGSERAKQFMEDLPQYNDEDESMIVDSLRRLKERQANMTEAERDAEVENIKKYIDEILNKE